MEHFRSTGAIVGGIAEGKTVTPPQIANNPKLQKELAELFSCVQAEITDPAKFKAVWEAMGRAEKAKDIRAFAAVLVKYCPSYDGAKYPEVQKLVGGLSLVTTLAMLALGCAGVYFVVRVMENR